MACKYWSGFFIQRKRLHGHSQVDFDEDYNAAEAKAYELEKEADPQMSLELEEVEDGATSLSD